MSCDLGPQLSAKHKRKNKMAFTKFFGLLLIPLFYRVAFASASINGDKVADFELISTDRIDAGKSKLEEFTAHAKSSDCWRKAVQGIEKRCKSLGDIEQSYLAIEFTNCHMSKSGRKIYSCSRETQSIEQCTGRMDDTTYLAYTTFFTHAANICFYVKSEIWQQRTEDTISKLSRTSQDVAEQLEESAERQFLVLERQNASLENQKEIISNEIHLSETLRNSTLNAKKAFEDMKQNALEQKALFSETFDGFFKSVEKVRELQSMILGEFISLQSVAFYIAAVCTCYFFTSTPRTAAARLPLFIGLFVVMFIERLLTSLGVTDTHPTGTVSYCIILISRGCTPLGQHQELRPLARSNTRSLQSTDFPSPPKLRSTDFPSLCACSESNLIGSGLNLLCLQSLLKSECH